MIRFQCLQALKEVKALENFKKQLVSSPDRAVYGPKAVLKATDAQAVEELLVTDSLFRSRNFAIRKQFVELIENVRDCGGKE